MSNNQNGKDPSVPIHPAIKLFLPFQLFFQRFVSGSYPLFGAAAGALIWANLAPEHYYHFWHTELSVSLGPLHIAKSLAHWIDDALMVLFFFVVGLEIKRELLVGGLSSPSQAILPLAAAAGGMLVPAAFYAIFNAGTETASGWGIPMATDIAFSLGILALLGARIPLGLKIFLSAFAIADDLGAVLVIAVFYTPEIVWSNLGIAFFFLVLLFIANRLWISQHLVYIILGLGLWAAILGSGVHATVAGVLVAMFIPARGEFDTDTFLSTVRAHLNAFDCEPGGCGHSILLNPIHMDAVEGIEYACQSVETPLQKLEHILEPWIAYVILPLFALANSGLVLTGLDWGTAVYHPVTLGIVMGLVVGKPLGIVLFTFLAVKFMKISLPQNIGWQHVVGIGFLGGIGFTMSLFISGLSFDRPEFSDFAKLGIIGASVLCGAIGYFILRVSKEATRA